MSIKAENIKYIYAKEHLSRLLLLRYKPGNKRRGLSGSNRNTGSGKSTLIQLLNGLENHLTEK